MPVRLLNYIYIYISFDGNSLACGLKLKRRDLEVGTDGDSLILKLNKKNVKTTGNFLHNS